MHRRFVFLSPPFPALHYALLAQYYTTEIITKLHIAKTTWKWVWQLEYKWHRTKREQQLFLDSYSTCTLTDLTTVICGKSTRNSGCILIAHVTNTFHQLTIQPSHLTGTPLPDRSRSVHLHHSIASSFVRRSLLRT